jgi:trk system potassium uptake protein TrkH
MLIRPQLHDIKIVGYYLGKIIAGLSILMSLPLFLGLFVSEFAAAIDFSIAVTTGLIIALLLMRLCRTSTDLNWMQGMLVVSLAWLCAMFLGAIPLFLSGHWKSYLDACFDAMSGFATTGLILVSDLDHLSLSCNFWRHLMMFIGGQGIVIIILSIMVRAGAGAFKMYISEGRGERILPNVIHTARFIWAVSVVYLILGTAALSLAQIVEGISPGSALFQGVCLFMAAFDTGGFTPRSQNILYYHSFTIEIITIIIMILGALNFNLHYAIWHGRKKNIFKDIEVKVFLFSISLLFLFVAIALNRAGVYQGIFSNFSRGFYQFISAHTGTGYATVYSQQFFNEWPALARAGLILAMGLGGCICSTTGGIKALRLGIIFEATLQDIKQIMLPEASKIAQKFYHIKEAILDDRMVRSACLVTLFYLLLYIVGALVGMCYGYPFMQALFESTSAGANVGLSCGITQAGMPTGLKITYIIQMWAGRLEFMSIFTLIGFLYAAVKGR